MYIFSSHGFEIIDEEYEKYIINKLGNLPNYILGMGNKGRFTVLEFVHIYVEDLQKNIAYMVTKPDIMRAMEEMALQTIVGIEDYYLMEILRRNIERDPDIKYFLFSRDMEIDQVCVKSFDED